MTKNQKLTATVVVAVAFGAVTVSIWLRHSSQPIKGTHVRAEVVAPELDDDAIARALHDNNVNVTDLTVASAGGVVILRGLGTVESVQKAGNIVRSLGVARVANLIRIAPAINDLEIQREAERELASNDALAGCTLKVHCERGILSVTGTVQRELQKDAARDALRAVHGAREVRIDLSL